MAKDQAASGELAVGIEPRVDDDAVCVDEPD
jgi:hypothetical protein